MAYLKSSIDGGLGLDESETVLDDDDDEKYNGDTEALALNVYTLFALLVVTPQLARKGNFIIVRRTCGLVEQHKGKNEPKRCVVLATS
jgi:hypothetical protein